MNKSFDYLYQLKAQDSLEVEDIGNTCIHIFNDIGYEWFLIIETELGDSYIKIFGPFNVDIDNYFGYGFMFNFQKKIYNEKTLSGIIDKFLNDPNKNITQAFECDKEEAYEKLLNIEFKEMR